MPACWDELPLVDGEPPATYLGAVSGGRDFSLAGLVVPSTNNHSELAAAPFRRTLGTSSRALTKHVRIHTHTHFQTKESRHPDSKVLRGLSKGSVRATVRAQ